MNAACWSPLRLPTKAWIPVWVRTATRTGKSSSKGWSGDSCPLPGSRFPTSRSRPIPGTLFGAGMEHDIGPDVRIRVAGHFDRDEQVLVRGPVSSSCTAPRFESTLASMRWILPAARSGCWGKPSRTSSTTRYEDNSDAGLRRFGVEEVFPGDYLQVTARQSPAQSGPVVATRIERENPGDKVVLRGTGERAR